MRIAQRLSEARRALQRRRDSRDYTRGAFERFRREAYSRLWIDAAEKLGLRTFVQGHILTITNGQHRFRVWGNLMVDGENAFAVRVANDKVITLQHLREAGIPTPEGRAFRRHERSDAIAYALGLGRSCVVKPARGTLLGQGVSTDLVSRREIARAFHRATLYCDVALVEEFVPGTSYRFLVYRGRCISIIERRMPFVTGDGRSTLRELVCAENAGCAPGYQWTPGEGLRLPIRLDVLTRRLLKRQGFTERSVPAAGVRVDLADVSNNQNGTLCAEVFGRVHPAIMAAAERSAEVVGLVLAGVDVISADIRSPQFVIHELNSQPGLLSHYAPLTDRRDPLRDILASEFAAMRLAS